MQYYKLYPMEESLKKVELDIMDGKSLHMSLQQFPIYPPKLIQLALIIIILGLVVGFILISMYLPMFEMSNSF